MADLVVLWKLKFHIFLQKAERCSFSGVLELFLVDHKFVLFLMFSFFFLLEYRSSWIFQIIFDNKAWMYVTIFQWDKKELNLLVSSA